MGAWSRLNIYIYILKTCDLEREEEEEEGVKEKKKEKKQSVQKARLASYPWKHPCLL